MAEKRKLLQEVEKTYKKVDEGIEIFEEIMDRMYEANSENQRDKFQDDLKREIKKLQRLRDLIKGWQFSSDIKDKDKLTTYRRLIESKMETFKDIERENKTKPHSKQGLCAEEKLDPREKEKTDTIDWLKGKIRLIQDDIDRTDVKMESLSTTTGKRRKGKDDSNKEKIEELKKHKERLNYHVTNLEVCMRLVTNDQKEPKDVLDVLQEAVDTYVEALDPDCEMNPSELDPFGVYEELDISDFIPQLAGVTTASIDDDKEDHAGRSTTTSPLLDETRNKSVVNEKTSTVPAAPVSAKVTRTSSGNNDDRSNVNSPRPTQTPPPTKPYNVAAAVPGKTTIPHANANAPTLASIVKQASSPVPSTPTTNVANAPPLVHPETPKPVQSIVPESPKSMTESVHTGIEKMGSPRPLISQVVSPSLSTQPPQLQQQLPTAKIEQKLVTSPPGIPIPQQSQSTQNSEPMTPDDVLLRELSGINNDPLLGTKSVDIPAWLGVSPLGRISLSEEQEKQINRLEEAHRTIPHRFDSEPQRPQMPRIPYQSFTSYPQSQNPMYQTIDYYMRLSPETLLFIFYYMEGSKAQLLAAQALKRLSWRFHTKYLMWFQRHEEPKLITDEYEQGSYVYFDFERWSQRKKEQFTFEYRYLEDRNLAELL